MSDFVHLHVHTEYSLLDGCTRIEKLIKKCVELKMPAVAITDHGNMFGTYHFYKAAKAGGIKPIIGCEFYISADMYNKVEKTSGDFCHLVLLAKNNEGYRSLCRLNSLSFTRGFYYKPRIDFKTLSEYSEGLICLSACLGGELPQAIMEMRYAEADAIIVRYKELFGDDYYIELQDHNMPEQKEVNRELLRLSKKHGVKLVATNDVHYLRKEDHEAQDILLCVQTGKFQDEQNRMRFPTEEFYFKTCEEMEALFKGYPDAIVNSVEIANKCNVTIGRKDLFPEFKLDKTTIGMPEYLEETDTPYEMLEKLVQRGIKEKYQNVTTDMLERIEYELGVVKRMKYVDYYLIVWDFIRYAEQIGVPVGPGRGSGAGSLVAYAIGITKVDPLRFNLIFERFLNPYRVSPPDFDIDFCFDRRGEVIDYVVKKYGAERVAQIITFGTMASKAAIKDVGRVLRVPYSDMDKITKLIPGKLSLAKIFGLQEMDDKERIDDEALSELRLLYENDAQLQRVVRLSIELEGMPRHTGIHAAGVVICKDEISKHMPIQKTGEDVTTQYNMKEVEDLGALKMDFLGLRTLTDISKTIALIEKSGKKINLYDTDYSDKNIYNLITSGDTDAVFQLESEGMKKLMRRLKPNSLEDIIAGVSLFRPGPMDSIDDFIAGKDNPLTIKYAHKSLEPILNVTYGCIVYQEQVMQIFRDLGGFSLAQADIVRRAMGKKNAAVMAQQKALFINGGENAEFKESYDGCVKRGVSAEIAEHLFHKMETFAEYAFNKSHAAAYAVIAYQTAYLKYYHIKEFLAAVLNNRITNPDEIKKYIGYCIEKNIEVLPPDVNISQSGFSVNDGKIRFGLTAVKNVGENAINSIITERDKNGSFKSLEDFIGRVELGSLNKRMVESLIRAGAFDCFGLFRSQMINSYEMIMERALRDKKQRESGQLFLFDMFENKSESFVYPQIDEYPAKIKYAYEKEVLGMYVSGDPLSEYSAFLSMTDFSTKELVIESDEDPDEAYRRLAEFDRRRVVMGGIMTDVNTKYTKSNSKMATARLEDLHGSIDLVFYPKDYEKNVQIIANDLAGYFTGTLNVRQDFKPSLMVSEITPFAEQKAQPKRKSTTLYLNITKEQLDEIRSILDSYPGNIDVCLVIEGKTFKSKNSVRRCSGLEVRLNAFLGDANVKFLEKL